MIIFNDRDDYNLVKINELKSVSLNLSFPSCVNFDKFLLGI